MLRFRRLSVVLGVALLGLVVAASGAAQSFSARRPSLRTPPPPASAPQGAACGPVALTQSTSASVTPFNSVACNSGGFHTDNHYWRAFSLPAMGITSGFQVCDVVVGVEEAIGGAGGTQPVTVNLYTSDPAFPGGVLTPIGTTSTTIADQSLTLVTIPVTGTVPEGSELVVEIFTPSGILDENSFFIGSNAAPETGPSYLSAADCGIPDPTPTGDLGFPDMHIVMAVDGIAIGPGGMEVDPAPGIVLSSGNGVLEIGDTASIAPSWENGGLVDFSLTGVASNLSGPFGPIYAIDDGTSDYDVIEALSTGSCVDCYAMTITGTRPVQHFDAHFDETVTASPLTLSGGLPQNTVLKTWTLHVGNSFTDVSTDTSTNPFYPSIETIYHHGVTGGCGDGTTYCPTASVLRQEMAPFLLKAFEGSGYTPPACAGVYGDVVCPATPEFPYSNFIEDIAARGITGGCIAGPPALYCPGDPVTRGQMAPFLLKTLLGGAYAPPACTGVYDDVVCPATPEFPFSDFIEDLNTRGITAGCAVGPPALYCPNDPVTREQMAAFLSLTFGLVLYGP